MPRTTIASPAQQPERYRLDLNDSDRIDEEVSGTASSSGAIKQKSWLAFSLRCVYPSQESSWIFITVRGKVVDGLLVDPGASRGLIGSDTLRLLIKSSMPPHHRRGIRWHRSMAVFSGISAKHERSLGRVQLPIGLYGFKKMSFTADVIGGDASFCPGLIPLHSMSLLGCVVYFGYYDNGDGLMGVYNHMLDDWCAQRLLLTDSGHYLLPTSNYDQPRQPELDKALFAGHRATGARREAQSHHGTSSGQYPSLNVSHAGLVWTGEAINPSDYVCKGRFSLHGR